MRVDTQVIRRVSIGAAFVAILVVGCGPDTDDRTTEPRSDSGLEATVEQRIRTQVTNGAAMAINVKVEGGVATLTGQVADESTKKKAEEVAEEVRGVDDVRNEIVVALGTPRGEAESN